MSVEVIATRRAQQQIAVLDRTHTRAFAAFLNDLSLNGCAALAYLTEDRLLRLTPHEVKQLERALDSEPEVVPQLKAFVRRLSEGSEPVSG